MAYGGENNGGVMAKWHQQSAAAPMDRRCACAPARISSSIAHLSSRREHQKSNQRRKMAASSIERNNGSIENVAIASQSEERKAANSGGIGGIEISAAQPKA
jgi:hypothetical protein